MKYTVINPNQIKSYVDKGYKIIDPHLHTLASPDVIPTKDVHPETLYHYMDKKGWDHIVFTDHDTLDGYKLLKGKKKKIVKGVEIKITPKNIKGHKNPHTIHINVYEVSDSQFKNLVKLSEAGDFYGFIKYLRKNNLKYALNHPFWHQMSEKPDWKMVITLLEEGYFDVIEYNWGRIPELNDLTIKLAEKLKIGLWAASDNHTAMPEFTTLVKGKNWDEIWKNVVAGKAVIVRQHVRENGKQVPTEDSHGYKKYIKVTIDKGCEQLMKVTPHQLLEKPFRIESGSFWRNSLVHFSTNGKLNKVVPMTKIISKSIEVNMKLFSSVLGRKFIRSQLRELKKIEELIDSI